MFAWTILLLLLFENVLNANKTANIFANANSPTNKPALLIVVCCFHQLGVSLLNFWHQLGIFSNLIGNATP